MVRSDVNVGEANTVKPMQHKNKTVTRQSVQKKGHSGAIYEAKDI